MDVTLNMSDSIFTRPGEKQEKAHKECERVLSWHISRGWVDPTIKESYIVCTKYGAVSATIIPKASFQ